MSSLSAYSPDDVRPSVVIRSLSTSYEAGPVLLSTPPLDPPLPPPPSFNLDNCVDNGTVVVVNRDDFGIADDTDDEKESSSSSILLKARFRDAVVIVGGHGRC